MTVQPRLASAVMLARNSTAGEGGIEVFMVRRVVQSEFMPDIYVFPGGSVSADDRAAEQAAGLCASLPASDADPEGRTTLGTGVRAAAIRELFEEGNVLLAYSQGKMLGVNPSSAERFAGYRQAFNDRKGSLVELAEAEHLQLATDRLAYIAHWITPEGMPKRFDTHFFLAQAPEEQEALYDQLETSAGAWLQPAAAMAASKTGEIPLAFATYYQLRLLSTFNSVQEGLDFSRKHTVPTYRPVLEKKEDGIYVHLTEEPESIWKV